MEDDILGSLGDLVRQRREELALTQPEAAAMAGVSVGSWSKIERGIGPISSRTRRAVARVTGLPIEVFTGGGPAPTRDVLTHQDLAQVGAELAAMGRRLTELSAKVARLAAE